MKASGTTLAGIFILICILAAMVSIAVMQVVRTVQDVGTGIYIVGGAIFLVCAALPIMLVILLRTWTKKGTNGN